MLFCFYKSMKNLGLKDITLFVLAIVFSVALMFAFVELPVWLDALLQQHIGSPGFDQGLNADTTYRSEIFIDALYLRWIGYGSLFVVCLFIITGFITKKSRWAWAGAFVIFLPVFAQFAYSMFFLSGLGILRTGWLPFMESSFPILDLGMVVYVPYWILLWFFGLFNWYAKDFISWLFMATGSFLFVWGVFVWLQSRFGNKEVATQRIYKFSRHPQYLGWIIWSYGLMIFSSTVNNMKKTWSDSTSFPWLIATMIIIAICMVEELTMRDKYGSTYDKYRKKAPFLLPLPMWLKKILKAPARLITKSNYPQNRKQIAGIMLIYTLLLMSVSLFWVDFGTELNAATWQIADDQKTIDSINLKIQQSSERRELYTHFDALRKVGNNATPQLISYLSDPDPVRREFAANQLGELKSKDAVDPLIVALSDDTWRVRHSAANALADIGDQRAAAPVMELVKSMAAGERFRYYSLLGSLKVEASWPYLIEGSTQPEWYKKVAALRAMTEINLEKAKPFVYEALYDTQFRVRREVVYMLLELKPKDAVKPLRHVIEDEDFETRFYAREAIKIIEKENN